MQSTRMKGEMAIQYRSIPIVLYWQNEKLVQVGDPSLVPACHMRVKPQFSRKEGLIEREMPFQRLVARYLSYCNVLEDFRLTWSHTNRA